MKNRPKKLANIRKKNSSIRNKNTYRKSFQAMPFSAKNQKLARKYDETKAFRLKCEKMYLRWDLY